MARETIIPSVSVEVIKEVVPPPPAATGIVAILGTTQRGPILTPTRIGRFADFVGVKEEGEEEETGFGAASDRSMPEAKQALQNGAKELVIVKLEGGTPAMIELDQAKSGTTAQKLKLTARAEGVWGNEIEVNVSRGKAKKTLRIKLFYRSELTETFDNVVMQSTADRYLVKILNALSELVTAGELTGSELLKETVDNLKFGGGTNPTDKHYEAGLTALEKVPDVDIIVPSIQYPQPGSFTEPEFKASQNIFAAVNSHCKIASDRANNCIGFGSVSREEGLDGDDTISSSRRTETFASDRFVITAPHGVVGAVAGLVVSLPVLQSPTFKAISGIATLERDFSPTDLRTLLKANIVPLDAKKGLGLIVIRGLTTDGDQISVRRVADFAVRNVKNIAEKFIGKLNTQEGRDALKQKIFEFLQQMEKDNAIIPSTNGKEPAFKIDVYSSQADFALGIVRVDIAVRPVRAIDFIFVTILVQV